MSTSTTMTPLKVPPKGIDVEVTYERVEVGRVVFVSPNWEDPEYLVLGDEVLGDAVLGGDGA